MFLSIARFEFRYILRNPLVWLTSALTFAMFFFAMNIEGFELGSEGGLLENAAYATLRNYLVLSVIFMFVTTSFVANVVLRDDETGFGPIMRSTRITKFDYLFGRYLGALAVAAVLTLLVPLAILLGSHMPWAPPGSLGPNRLADHLYGYFLIAMPNILVHSAIFFALATITRSMMATYLGVIAFVGTFFTLQDALRRPQLEWTVAVAEPFASRALKDATRYWTIAQRDTLLPEFSGALLYNRLLWVGVALLFLAVTYATYRFADRGTSKKQKLEPTDAPIVPSSNVLPQPHHDGAASRALLWMRTRFEARQVLFSPAFPVLMAWGLYTTIFVLLTQRHPDYLPSYPTTLSLIPEIEDAFRVIPLVVAIYYAGDLVWRERDRRVHELIDASPLPNWAYVVPKTTALALVFVSMLAVNVAAAVILQLSVGFTDIELGKYLLWYVLPVSFDSLLLVAVAIFIQSLSPHKAVGWGVMTLFLVWKELNQTIKHNLLLYGGKPNMPLSDLNGAGSFWIGPWMFRLYWGAFALLLLVVAHLLWRRGTEIRLRPRVALAWRRLRGAPGWVAAAALLTFTATGAWAFYNTNVLNHYESGDAAGESKAEFERRFRRYVNLPQPSLEELKLDIAVFPRERRAVTKGAFVLRNRTSQPIADVHIRAIDPEGMELTASSIANARLVLDDERYDYRIYRLDRPMQPGESCVLTFETSRWHRGFPNKFPTTSLIENGTFLHESQVMPIIGTNITDFHWDSETRRKYGLPGDLAPPKLEDLSRTTKPSFDNTWVRKSDITVSTDADQTPVAPGSEVSDVTRDGRRIVRYVSNAPIRPRFAVQSAHYAEKHRNHRGIDLAVYYHPRHAWNVDRMLDAMAAALDYCQANFGPYQFDHFRVVEFPAYRNAAQAFAGTIPFSESVGFIADYGNPGTIDYVTGITVHEFSHQYWPHQIIAAETEGHTVLSETLAQYSAQMVLKHMRGEDQIRRYLQFELDRYLNGRAWSTQEPTLARVIGDNYIAYRKGAMVMHLLQKRLGEEAVNRALRSVLARYKFKETPFARTVDLIDAFRAEAKTAEDQALITDLWERITLYDLKVTQPTAVQRADGKWDVTVPIEAKKFYADEKGKETETPLHERIEVGLFTAEPGRLTFDKADVIHMQRYPIRTGRQVLHFVSARKPLFAGVDPYNYYIDRDSADNVLPLPAGAGRGPG
jgi:ABC-2 type transport system permease protein